MKHVALWGGLVLSLPVLLGGGPPRDGVRVAAIQYSGDPTTVTSSCPAEEAACGLRRLVERAHEQGAKIAVAPEYALGGVEKDPAVGEPVIQGQLAVVSATASDLEMFVVANILTETAAKRRHNTLVAFGPDGAVVAKHHKIELYAGEKDDLTPGKDVTFFNSPYGRIAMLVCADLYADPAFHERIIEEGADIVIVSSQWTVDQAQRWQAAFARDWGVFVVAANSSTGQGRGGGVFDPTGKALGRGHADTNAVVIADLDLSER